MEALLSTQQVADRLRVDRKTVLRYLHAGKLRGSRIGRDYRIPEGSVRALLAPSAAQRTIKPGTSRSPGSRVENRSAQNRSSLANSGSSSSSSGGRKKRQPPHIP